MWRIATIKSGQHRNRTLWVWDAPPVVNDKPHKSLTTGQIYDHPYGYLKSNLRASDGGNVMIPFDHVILGSEYRIRLAPIELIAWVQQKMKCRYCTRLAHSLDCGKCQRCCDSETDLIKDYHTSPGKQLDS